MKKWSEIRSQKLSPEQRAEVDQLVQQDLLEMSLREMRELAGKTQVALAGDLETTQSELSRLERREDFLLSTLRRYVKALGGDLEVVARFGDKAIRLRGV